MDRAATQEVFSEFLSNRSLAEASHHTRTWVSALLCGGA